MKKKSKGLDLNKKSFLLAVAVLFALMVLTYVLTLVIPGGLYTRTCDAEGNVTIDAINGFQYVEGGIPFWKWLLSPVLVLGAEGNTTIIAVILFLLVIGGIFNCLDKCGMMEHMLQKIIRRYADRRYLLISVVSGFFMFLGAFVGSFEEAVPLVPIATALAVGLGFDILTGLGMSLVSVGCGFASGVLNPFTVGVAQKLAGVPMFSGLWFRLLSAVVIYIFLLIFLRHHAHSVEKPVDPNFLAAEREEDPKLDRAIVCFAVILGVGILSILSSVFLTFLQDFTMIIVVLMFLVAGIVSAKVSGMTWKHFGKVYLDGVVSIMPAIIMILLASSVRYTLEEASIMDTILHSAAVLCNGLPKGVVILLLYLVALVVNFFVSSGSAEAILLMPLLIPIAKSAGISSQLTILAYAYGDGFSNVFYPTNAVLLISLGLVGLGYKDYVKWGWKFQILNLILTSGLLLLGLAVGY